MKRPGYELYSQGGWSGWIDGDWSGTFAGRDPLDALRAWRYSVVRARPSAWVARVESGQGVLYAKHLTAQNARDAQGLAWFARVKWLTRRSLAVGTLDVVNGMRGAGVTAPRVVLAARRRVGVTVEELVVSEAGGGVTLRAALRDSADAKALAIHLERAASAIAALHRSGFVHGDLLPGNILIDDAGGVSFLDNDRTQRVRTPGRKWVLQRRNLVQFGTRLRPHGVWAMRWFLRAYCDELGLNGWRRRSVKSSVLRASRCRWLEKRRVKRREIAAGRVPADSLKRIRVRVFAEPGGGAGSTRVVSRSNALAN